MFNRDEKYILIGYSFGSLLAIKFANLLESKGKSGNIVIIDGSPKFLNEMLNQLLPADCSDEFIKGITIQSCIKLLFRDSAQEISKKVFTKPTIEERLEEFLTNAVQRSEYSKDYGRKMITGLTNRIKICSNVEKLTFSVLKNSPMTFIKASESSLTKIDEDFGLKKYVEGVIQINVVNGDHLSILSSSELIDIINSIM